MCVQTGANRCKSVLCFTLTGSLDSDVFTGVVSNGIDVADCDMAAGNSTRVKPGVCDRHLDILSIAALERVFKV